MFRWYRPVSYTHLDVYKRQGALYVHMLRDRGEVFQKILRAALGTEGVVLFHCTAGKDRTGVLAALLLLAAGVDRETVVAEYALSLIHISSVHWYGSR